MKYKVIDISEEDYGCEGIQKWLKIADRYLRENGIDIGSVITAD